jgi:hypothetical protein
MHKRVDRAACLALADYADGKLAAGVRLGLGRGARTPPRARGRLDPVGVEARAAGFDQRPLARERHASAAAN